VTNLTDTKAKVCHNKYMEITVYNPKNGKTTSIFGIIEKTNVLHTTIRLTQAFGVLVAGNIKLVNTDWIVSK
jgi:hypothetical protein